MPAGKVFDKIRYLLMIKTFNRLRVQDNSFKLTKGIYKKTHS